MFLFQTNVSELPGCLFFQLCGDPLYRPLPVLSGNVWIYALIAQVLDVRSQEGFWLLDMVEGR